MLKIDTQPATLNLTSVLRILLHRRRFILAFSFGTAVSLFCASLLLQNTFKAVALVMPPDRTSGALSMMSAGASASSAIPTGALAALNMKNPADMYVALMLSPVVEDAVIDRFNLRTLYRNKHLSLVRKRLEENTQILADGKSGIISVAVVDTDPERAANIANGIVQAFDKFSSQLAITDAARRRLFFERQLAESKDNLTRSEDALKSTSTRTGVLEPEGTVRAMIGYEAQLRGQITTKIVELQSMKVYLADDNPQIQTATRELQSLRQQADALAAKNGGNDAYSKSTASSSSLDYMRALRDVRIDQALFEVLLKNLEAAKLDEAREGNVVQIVSVAAPPDLKDGPHRSFFLVGGFVLGFILSIIWVFLSWTKRWMLAPDPDLPL